MADQGQELLRKAWLGGRKGHLTAWSEAKLWAIREVWRSQHESEHGLQTFAATKVAKRGVTGEKKHPTPQAVGQFYDKVDSDPEWFPGKQFQEGRGPARVVTGPKASVIARSAQSMKRRGVEPTYRSIVATCPAATRNPNTGQAVSKKRVYDVFREHCKDPGADQNWKHKARYSKTALSPETMAKRYAFGVHVQGMGRRAVYFYNHTVWADPLDHWCDQSRKELAWCKGLGAGGGSSRSTTSKLLGGDRRDRWPLGPLGLRRG